ncbi:MAG: hypothetical protein HUJ61_01895, partial [Bacilli bacterium]|nr:hypothetical protein [Bacilli bacterium]
MKKNLRLVLYLSFITGIGTIISCTTYAWFQSQTDSTFNIGGSTTASYFGGGDGSAAFPYLIKNKRHLYNLAWLQYMGTFNQADSSNSGNIKQYYFELANNVDMTGLNIPPIGTTKYPFLGNFNGNGYNISNLGTSNYFSDYSSSHPSIYNSVTDVNIIGMFGVIGYISGMENSTLTYNKTVNSVTDFNIINPIIKSMASNTLSGLIAGYVNGNLSNVGVKSGNLKYGIGSSALGSSGPIETDKLSKYTLIGDYNDNDNGTEWDGMPGAGTAYGTSTDIKALYDSYPSQSAAEAGVLAGEAFPFAAINDTVVNPPSSTISVQLNAGYKNLPAAKTHAAAENNIGYYVGSDVKVYYKGGYNYTGTYYFPRDNGGSYSLPATVNNVLRNAPPEEVTSYINEKGNYMIRMMGTQQLDVQNESGMCVVPNGRVGDYVGNVLLPIRCIWVAPVNVGSFKLVCPVKDGNMGLRIIRLTRYIPGNYGSRFTGSQRIDNLEFNGTLLQNYTYYFEMEVTQDDIDAGYEYAITGGDNYKTYI